MLDPKSNLGTHRHVAQLHRTLPQPNCRPPPLPLASHIHSHGYNILRGACSNRVSDWGEGRPHAVVFSSGCFAVANHCNTRRHHERHRQVRVFLGIDQQSCYTKADLVRRDAGTERICAVRFNGARQDLSGVQPTPTPLAASHSHESPPAPTNATIIRPRF